MIQPQFTYARPFSEGLAAAANDDVAFGYIDHQGKTVIPFVYHNVYPGNFSEGWARSGQASRSLMWIIRTCLRSLCRLVFILRDMIFTMEWRASTRTAYRWVSSTAEDTLWLQIIITI